MKVYVIRHGRTDSNDNGLYNGSLCDEDINETGIKQAKEASILLKDKEIDLVISSPMKRTKHTLNLLNVNKPVIYDERLVDRNFGELTNKPVNDLLCDTNESVEKDEAVIKRVFESLDDIKRNYSNKNILIVTHGAVTIAISKYFLKEGLTRCQRNCEIKEYEW